MRLLSPWYLTKSSPFPCCMSGCELYCKGAWECLATRFCSVPLLLAGRLRAAPEGHKCITFLWDSEECHCHPAPLTEEKVKGPAQGCTVCLQQSRVGQSQDLLCLLLGVTSPTLRCSQTSPSAEQWSRSHPLSAGLTDSLWKGDMPAPLAATYTITTHAGREWGDVWLGSACSGAYSSPCTVIILSTSVFFQFYVSFSFLVFGIFAFI